MYLDGEYLLKNPSYHVEDSPWKAKQILKMMNKHNLNAATVCEVGCGAGGILSQLQLQMPEDVIFHGYEISPQGFDLCKQRSNERLLFFHEDLLSKDTPPFDVLLCIDVLEHVDDYMGFLKKLRHKARNKIFHIPLDLSVQTVLRCTPIIFWRRNRGHLHYFMKETALLTLLDNGYEIVDYFYTPASIEIGKTFNDKLAKLPLKAFSLINLDLTVRIFGGYSLLVLAR